MSTERDELVQIIRENRIRWATDTEHRESQAAQAAAILAAGYVKAEPAWAETLINDGTYEYTVSSDCDGSNVNHWRRIPGLTYEGQASPWAIYTPGES